MGITIHYRFSRQTEPEELMKQAEKLAKKLKWKIIERKRNKLILHPSNDCEGIELHWHKVKTIKKREGWDYNKASLEDFGETYEENWFCSGFTKTQYTGFQIHIQVAEFLRYVASFCEKTEISDEADYYETRDTEKLKTQLDSSAKMIGMLTSQLKEVFGDKIITGDEL